MIIWSFKIPAYIWYLSGALLEQVGYKKSETFNSTDDNIQAMVFITMIILVQTIRGASWGLYYNFEIKERYKFNKMTTGLYFCDNVKKLLLIFILGYPIFYLFMKLIDWGGENFVLYLSIFTIVFFLVFLQLIPILIMPIFNKYNDLTEAEGDLKSQIE